MFLTEPCDTSPRVFLVDDIIENLVDGLTDSHCNVKAAYRGHLISSADISQHLITSYWVYDDVRMPPNSMGYR